MLAVFVMVETANPLPNDISQLKGIIAGQVLSLRNKQEELARKDAQIERLAEMVEEIEALLPHVLIPTKHNDSRSPEAAAA